MNILTLSVVDQPPPWVFEGRGFQVNFDGLFFVLCILVCVDWICGVTLSWIKNKTLSDSMLIGILRKIGEIMLVIVVDVVCDVTVQDHRVIRSGLLIALVAYELVSFGEHLTLSGIWVPPIVGKLLKHLEVSNKEDKNESHKNNPLNRWALHIYEVKYFDVILTLFYLQLSLIICNNLHSKRKKKAYNQAFSL